MLETMERTSYGRVGCNKPLPPQPLLPGIPFPFLPGHPAVSKMCPIPPNTFTRLQMARRMSQGGIPPHFALSALTQMPQLCGRPSQHQLDTIQHQQQQHQQRHPSLPPFPFQISPFMTSQIIAPAGTHKSMTPQEISTMKYIGFEFSQKELDMVLYGYARCATEKENRPCLGLALSGLRIGELSYGIDRILGQSSPRSNPQTHIAPNTIEVPEGLEIQHTTFAGITHYGVFCSGPTIQKGQVFGPFQGKLVNMSEIKTNDDNSFMWEIFKEGKLSHFIDGRGNSGNWLAYVNCARYAQEQNLIAIQNEGEITYEACKDISEGSELLVWYGDAYHQIMGIPINLKDSHRDGVAIETQTGGAGFKCERCGKVFTYEYYRDKHLKYTRCVDQGDRKFPCGLCNRSFEKRDRLRIHILHVHEKHRPHKCHVCAKSFSQSSSLNKHMRVHSGERPYKCVYCSKAFTASSILRTHIRQHSGEKPFKCKHCGKAFASHAAHDSHVRRTHTKDKCGDININKNPRLLEDTIDVVGYEPVTV